MKDYEKKMSNLLIKQRGMCLSCGKELDYSKKIDLAHSIKASKKNYQLFGSDVIDHEFNLTATHPRACNDAQNKSRAAHPVESSERIIDIIHDLIADKPLRRDYDALEQALNNIDNTTDISFNHSRTRFMLKEWFAKYQEI